VARSPVPTPGARLARALALAGLAAGLLGASDSVIRSVRAVGPYLAVRLAGDEAHALLLPATPGCAAVARPEASVDWVDRGFPGRLASGDATCSAAGILDLARWRDRRPRPGGPPAPRATARWSVMHRDGSHALLRGRFPLAGLVGMPGGYDLVAVVADDPACAGLFAESEGSLEYRASGPVAYRLAAGDSRCEVLGFARPPPPDQASE